ncbi:MAG: DUF6493 family protein [Pirellulaceae bacterium]
MPLDQAKLEALLNKGNTSKKVLAFFKGASEKDRQALSKYCENWFKTNLKDQRDNFMQETSPGTFSFRKNELLSSATVAAFCCCSYATIKNGGWHIRSFCELCCDAIRDRRPAWAGQWVAQMMRTGWASDWEPLRALIRDGVCDPPDGDDYIRQMIDGVSLKVTSVAPRLLADPQLLERDFWRIFEVPGQMRNASLIGYLDAAWMKGILQLEKKKKLDRQRLFEACLSTPHMGFNQSQIKFFLELHDALKPTALEQQQMLDAYCGLVESTLPPVAKWSFETLRSIDKKQPIDTTKLCEFIATLMRSPIKSQVKQALAWLQQLLKRDPKQQAAICLTAVQGLHHEKPDIQTEVWKFIEKNAHPTRELLEELHGIANDTSASTRKSIHAWLQQHSPSQSPNKHATPSASDAKEIKALLADAKRTPAKLATLCGITQLAKNLANQTANIPPTNFSGMEFCRLQEAQPLEPITTFTQLLEVASMALEDRTRFEDAERVLDAITRIAAPEEHELLSPLRKRLKQRWKRTGGFFIGLGTNIDLIPLLLIWSKTMSAKEIMAQPQQQYWSGAAGLVGFLALRAQAVFERLAAEQPLQLVGTATHSGGWIDPLVLVERVKQCSDQTMLVDFDQVLSLLRLAPENRKAALKKLDSAKSLQGEFADALRYALGGESSSGNRKFGKSPHLWIAAARCRAPFDDDLAVEKRFPQLGPDAGLVAKYHFTKHCRDKKYRWYEWRYYAENSPPVKALEYGTNQALNHSQWLLASVIPHLFCEHSSAGAADTKAEPKEMAQCAATVWPLNRDGFYINRMEPSDDLDPLFDPCTPMRLPQMFALIQALGSGFAPEVASGIDLAIATIEDGRYDVSIAGQALALEIEKVQRHAKSLEKVAQASPLHAYQITQSLIAMFEHPLAEIPGRISDLLTLLFELLQELEMQFPESAASSLGKQVAGSGKAAKLAQQICDYAPPTEFNAQPFLCEALSHRLRIKRRLC